MMSDEANAINRAYRRKRFLDDLKTARTETAMRMIAEMVFDIQDFQETQNHNSTEARKQLEKLDKKFWALLVLLAIHFAVSVSPEITFVLERLLPFLVKFVGA